MEDILEKTINLQVEVEDDWKIEESIKGLTENNIYHGRIWTNKKFNKNLINTVLSRLWGIESYEWTIKIKDQ